MKAVLHKNFNLGSELKHLQQNFTTAKLLKCCIAGQVRILDFYFFEKIYRTDEVKSTRMKFTIDTFIVSFIHNIFRSYQSHLKIYMEIQEI